MTTFHAIATRAAHLACWGALLAAGAAQADTAASSALDLRLANASPIAAAPAPTAQDIQAQLARALADGPPSQRADQQTLAYSAPIQLLGSSRIVGLPRDGGSPFLEPVITTVPTWARPAGKATFQEFTSRLFSTAD